MPIRAWSWMVQACGDVMSDGHIVADMRGTCLMGHMDTGAVLHIGAVADGDRCHVATYHRVEPHRTLVTHRHITDDSGVLTKIAVSPPFGSETAV